MAGNNIAEASVRIYAAGAKYINDILAVLICVYSAQNLISQPGSSSLAFVAFTHILIYPIVRFVLGILSFIPASICRLIVKHIDKKRMSQREHDREDRSDRCEGDSETGDDQLQAALSYYGLRMPFSRQQIKERRRQLMKKAHPDSGGSVEDATRINVYFDILEKYAC